MRKIILIFSLIALLTFVFPVAAATSPAPVLDQGEGGTLLAKLAYFNQFLASQIAELWQGLFVQEPHSQIQMQLREWKILKDFAQMLERTGQIQGNPGS
jgi:hypothetical protein